MSADDPPVSDRVEPDLVGAIEDMVEQLHARSDSADLASRLAWLIDVLIQRGHLAPGHRKLLARITGDRGKVQLAMYRDKRSLRSPDVDCASLIPLCHARCCSFDVTLSAEDVIEGKLPWVLEQPYMLPKAKGTGYCTCMREDGGCDVYADRPGTCRIYDCRHDTRVWLDYEQRIPAPMPPGLTPKR